MEVRVAGAAVALLLATGAAADVAAVLFPAVDPAVEVVPLPAVAGAAVAASSAADPGAARAVQATKSATEKSAFPLSEDSVLSDVSVTAVEESIRASEESGVAVAVAVAAVLWR